ncbi:hypothetical protein CAPTEDRAFT_210913 [Capitella teleta]|uniref:Uncharacterized protein n=1 Tax=Capitella teleta TaxID=283909 RepID=R7V6G7_CAPTE|nr:hypothetical protein CAPTEDRAFT_210913 [Capitella teleta]|eukprot:ELU14458.1 hypothetical protein CAPTEDRAFT_210913 [Capitella teleta]
MTHQVSDCENYDSYLHFIGCHNPERQPFSPLSHSQESDNGELLYHCTTPKKRRGAYEKGQHQMILDDIIPESEVPDREKAWIDPKSAAAVKVEELVFNNHRLKDLATLSPHFQTYDLEPFHSLLNQFALN